MMSLSVGGIRMARNGVIRTPMPRRPCETESSLASEPRSCSSAEPEYWVVFLWPLYPARLRNRAPLYSGG